MRATRHGKSGIISAKNTIDAMNMPRPAMEMRTHDSTLDTHHSLVEGAYAISSALS